MPPAFVLSQDQTLRKKNSYQSVWFSFLWFLVVNYLKSQCNFQVTSHYSIFNQPPKKRSFNIASFKIECKLNFKLFSKFWQNLKLSFSSARVSFEAQQDHNIAEFRTASSSNQRFFQVFRVFSSLQDETLETASVSYTKETDRRFQRKMSIHSATEWT